MANTTLLMSPNETTPPVDYEPADALLGANYSIPVMWLSMFEEADIVGWPSSLDEELFFAALIAERAICLERASMRLNLWRGWTASLRDIGDQWLRFLRDQNGRHFAIWTEELAAMHTTAQDWERVLRSYLAALDNPQAPGFADVLGQSYLQVEPRDPFRLVVTTGENLALAACGYSWSAAAPWE